MLVVEKYVRNEPMKEIFEQIMQEFVEARDSKPLKENPTADLIRNGACNAIKALIPLDATRYLVQGSVGIGGWAEVPWIGIFDNKVTKGAQEGYYVVYLFSNDMERVYLSLNQGVTWFNNNYRRAESQKKIKAVTKYWQSKLSSTLTDFPVLEIDLGSDLGKLGTDYQFAHICGKVYERGSIPSSDELACDLLGMIGVYRELVSKIQQDYDTFSSEEVNLAILADI